MGLSTPSTTYIVELAQLFHVSSDYLLGLPDNAAIDISSLTEREIQLLYELIEYFRTKNNPG